MTAGRTHSAPAIEALASRLPVARWSVPFLVLLAASIAIFIATIWLDALTHPHGRVDGKLDLAAILNAILHQDLEQARNTLAGLGEIMAAVLGLALTVSSIIVQLAATRFTPHVTSLFFRARPNLAVLGFFVVCNIFVLWVNFSVGENYLPHWGTLLSMMLLTASLLLLFPYFAYVFSFLEPQSIIARITADGLRSTRPERLGDALEAQRKKAVESIEHLANIALNAIQQKDKNNASSAVDALCRFASHYGEHKEQCPERWFELPPWERQNPDFVSLSDEAIDTMRQRQTWLEWKILKQYQMLLSEGLLNLKEIGHLVAIDTRRIGQAAAARGDLQTLDLSIKFFNTYLRATINAADVRTAYNILHQYRQLGEFVLTPNESTDTGRRSRIALDERVVQLASYFRYYSTTAFKRGLTFLSEVVAHDMGTLCAFAYEQRSPAHDDLLTIFLTVDETASASQQEKTLRGVRRAQVKLATTYLLRGAEDSAKIIQEDLMREPADRLRRIWEELLSLDKREFWEVNDRGENFDYLSSAQKGKLEPFFSGFPALAEGKAPTKKRLTMMPTSS